MSPTVLVRILGLCNLVAGALLVWAPTLVAPLEGAGSPAAVLAFRSAAVLLVAVAAGAWVLPAGALRPFLWLFGVSVKLAAAAIWAAAAMSAGTPQLWLGAGVDASVAAVIATGLLLQTHASR